MLQMFAASMDLESEPQADQSFQLGEYRKPPKIDIGSIQNKKYQETTPEINNLEWDLTPAKISAPNSKKTKSYNILDF